MLRYGLYASITAFSLLTIGLGCSSSSATGSGGGGSSGGTGGGGGSAPACKEQPFAAWAPDAKLLSLVATADGAAVLVEGKTSLDVYIDGSKKRTLAMSDPDHYGFYGELWTRYDGAVCAAFTEWVKSGKVATLKIACGDDAITDTMLEPDTKGGSSIPLAPVQGSVTGETDIYATDFAAVTLFQGDASGWNKVELFQSSISYPGNAVSFLGVPVACYISASKHLSLASGSNADDLTDMGGTATRCRLATDGQSLFIAADNRFASLDKSSTQINTQVVKGLESSTIIDMAAHAGVAFGAVSDANSNELQIVNLATGAPLTWALPSGAAGYSARLAARPNGALVLATMDDKGQVQVGATCP